MNSISFRTYKVPQQPNGLPRRQPSGRGPKVAFSSGLNRLISAAVVSSRFCRLLLSDPFAVLALGYNGESFDLTADELAHVKLIRANSLQGFAAQLVEKMQGDIVDSGHYGPEEMWASRARVNFERAEY